MRFALYCRELRGGGARAVGVGLLKSLSQRTHEHEIIAYVPDDAEFRAIQGEGVQIIPAESKGGGHHLLAHQRVRRELADARPDALFMMGNRGLVAPPCPQAVLIHNPWLVYPESPAWRRCTPRDFAYRQIRNVFIRQGIRHSDIIAAQTPVMLYRIHRQFGIPMNRLALIPNSVTAAGDDSPLKTESSQKIDADTHPHKALCLTRYYTHKNIESLLPVADLLLAQGRTDIGIYVTIEPSQGSGAKRFLEEVEKKGRSRILHNLGQIPMAHVASCYGAVDALLLPTLLESFTNTYVDAMGFGVPIITSNMDFAKTVCGEAALYIDPMQAESMVSALTSLATETDAWQTRIAAGRARCETLFVNWDIIADKVLNMLECTARRRSVDHLQDERWTLEAAGAV